MPGKTDSTTYANTPHTRIPLPSTYTEPLLSTVNSTVNSTMHMRVRMRIMCQNVGVSHVKVLELARPLFSPHKDIALLAKSTNSAARKKCKCLHAETYTRPQLLCTACTMYWYYSLSAFNKVWLVHT